MSETANKTDRPDSNTAPRSSDRLPEEAAPLTRQSVWLAARQHLAAMSQIGATTLPRGKGELAFSFSSEPAESPDQSPDQKKAETTPQRPPAHQPTQASPQPAAPKPKSPSSQPSLPLQSLEGDYGASLLLNDRRAALEAIATQCRQCTRCPELSSTRTQTVFGSGCLTPRLVFIGEGPGADEDRTGLPFVGAAGKLLDRILAACTIERSEVYILNAVKCRPPRNRTPSTSELDHCWEYAQRQLDILQPEFICCLGSVAAKRVLNTTESLGRLRQRFHTYRGSRVLVTYHPAYLLRTESAKKHVWNDMKLLMKEMGIDLPNG